MNQTDRMRTLSGYSVLKSLVGFAMSATLLMTACSDDSPSIPDPEVIASGKQTFRFDTFGDEKFWTDTLRMHEVIQKAVTPAVALSVGLKVDADALPATLKSAIAAGQVDLNSTASTLALIKLNAVLGINGNVQTVNGKDTLMRVGITCALCHSSVDNSFAPGIGSRRDGWANVDLNPGAIVGLSPALTPSQKAIY